MRKNRVLILALTLVLIFGVSVGGTLAWLLDKTDPVTNTFSASDITIELKEHTYDAETDKLTENETTDGVSNYKMIPGWTIPKDPWAKVSADSEDCYLFVKIGSETATISKNANGTYSLGDYIVYAVNSEWTALSGHDNVFYKVVDGTTYQKGIPHSILGGGSYTDPMRTDTVETDDVNISWSANQVGVKPSVTKEMMNALTSANQPKLTFTAYAVQLWKSNNPGTEATDEQISAAQFTAAEAWEKAAAMG